MEFKRSPTTHFKGLVFCMLSALTVVCFATYLKAAIHIEVMVIMWCCRIGMLVMALPLSVYRQDNPLGPKGKRLALTLSTLLGIAYMVPYMYACRLLPIAVAITICCSYQAVTVILGRLVLRESVNAAKVIGVVLSICGVILTSRLQGLIQLPGAFSTVESGIGIIFAIAAVIFRALFFITLRKTHGVHVAVVILNQGVIGTIAFAILCPLHSSFTVMQCNWEMYAISALAFLTVVSFLVHVKAVHFEDAGVVAVSISAGEIIISFLTQILGFQELADAYAISGAIAMLVSLVFIRLDSIVILFPPESAIRTLCSYLLR